MKFDNRSITSATPDLADEEFYISHCLKENEGFVQSFFMTAQHIEEVSLVNSKDICDNTILILAAHCMNLKSLNVSRARSITNSSIIQLSEACRNLTSINLSQCFGLKGDTALLAVIQNCTHMTSFDLNNSEAATDNAIVAMADHCGAKLRRLMLSGVHTLHKQETVLHLLSRCPNLAELSLKDCRNTVLTRQSIDSIAEHCKLMSTLLVGGTRMLNDECIDNLARNCVHLRFLDISGLSLSIKSIQSLVHYSHALETINFYQYNENFREYRDANDLHDAAFRVLATQHFASFTVLNLCQCVVTGVPRERTEGKEKVGMLPARKKSKVDAADTRELAAGDAQSEETQATAEAEAEEEAEEEDPPFKPGSGCYGEDEDYQPGSLKSATVTNLLAPLCGALTELHMNSYCTAADCMAIIQACDGSLLKVFRAYLLKLTDEHVLAIAEKCCNLTTLMLEHVESITATSVCALIAANRDLTDVKISECRMLEGPRRTTGLGFGSNMFAGVQSVGAASTSAITPFDFVIRGMPPPPPPPAAASADSAQSSVDSASGMDKCVLTLAKHCPQLQSVDISSTNGVVADASLTELARGCPRIFFINASSATRPHRMSDATVAEFIEHCPALREVIMTTTRMNFGEPAPQKHKAEVKYNVN
eukprot:gene31307-37836_t